MSLSIVTAVEAVKAALLLRRPDLTSMYGTPDKPQFDAIKAVYQDYDRFRQIVLQELEKWPLIDRYLRHIVEHRLNQECALASPIIQALFAPFGLWDLDQRLDRTYHIPNFETIMMEAHPPSAPELGEETDEVFLDFWTEILVADILLHRLGFRPVEKVVRGKDQPCVDFIAMYGNLELAIEVGRIRKRDFKGSTLPGGSEDCRNPENLTIIKKAVRGKLSDKNRQLGSFRTAEGRSFASQVVALKTSQWEYQDCSHVVAEVARQLLRDRVYSEINALLLIYDVENYEVVENEAILTTKE